MWNRRLKLSEMINITNRNVLPWIFQNPVYRQVVCPTYPCKSRFLCAIVD